MRHGLEPGMRVRCVRGAYGFLTVGKEYHLVNVTGEFVWLCDDNDERSNWRPDRFKPVVRVKARCVPSLSVLVARAKSAVERMTPEQQQAMQVAQRESWVRGEMDMSRIERDQTRRSAPRS